MNFSKSVLLVSLVLHLISILHIKASSMSPLFPEILQGHVSFFSVSRAVFMVLEHVGGSCLIRLMMCLTPFWDGAPGFT